MKTRRGKLVALGSVGLGIVVLLFAGYSSRRLFLEQWHLPGLRSNDEETRKEAAEALREYGSVRSITPLMKANSDSLTLLLQDRGIPDALVGIEKYYAMLDQQSVDRQLPDLDVRLTDLDICPYSLSLNRIVEREKKAAVPFLSEGLQDDNWCARWLAVHLLGRLGADAEDAVSALRAKTEDPNPFVRRAALRVLRSLQDSGKPEPSAKDVPY